MWQECVTQERQIYQALQYHTLKLYAVSDHFCLLFQLKKKVTKRDNTTTEKHNTNFLSFNKPSVCVEFSVYCSKAHTVRSLVFAVFTQQPNQGGSRVS